MDIRAGKGPVAEMDDRVGWRPGRYGLREVGIAFLAACSLAAPVGAVGGWAMYSDWREEEEARRAAIWAAQAYERLAAAPAQPVIDIAQAVHGREVFSTVCFACHGADGKGIEEMGKSLVESDFVAGQQDEQLLSFMVTGRPFAKPMPMPARGGRADLSDDDLRDVVAYVRGLQDPRRMPALPAIVVAGPTEEQKKAALVSAGGDAELAEYIASGDRLFHATCVACHGKAGVGVAGNGKTLVGNSFIKSVDEDGLLAFIKQGRSPTDPKNTTGIQMPPKGGNPALSDDDILDIISYLRTLQGEAPKAAAAATGQ